jgi:large subunit ribosomal protein L29
MTIKELRVKPLTELNTILSEKREDLLKMRFRVAQRQLKKVSDIKIVKKDIAKIKTLIREKENLVASKHETVKKDEK